MNEVANFMSGLSYYDPHTIDQREGFSSEDREAYYEYHEVISSRPTRKGNDGRLNYRLSILQ
jgi:hypothetical protein